MNDLLIAWNVEYAVALKNIAVRRMDWHSCTTLLRRAEIDSLCGSRAVSRPITQQPVGSAPIVEYSMRGIKGCDGRSSID